MARDGSETIKERTRKWLETDAAQGLIARVARSILTDPISARLYRAFEARDAFSGHLNAELLDEIRSEISCFILEARRIQAILTASAGGFDRSRFLRAAFMNYMKDRLRRVDRDPRRYLQKRIGGILKKSSDFFTTAEGRKGTAFSMARESRRTPPLVEEDLSAIAYPYETGPGLSFDAVNHKTVLLGLAKAFWDGACALWDGAPVWVDVRDLVGWIGMHVPLGSPVPQTQSREGCDQAQDKISLLADERLSPDREVFDAEMVRAWAGNFAARLTRKQATVMLLHHGKGESLEQIARRLDLKGPSGPSYHLRQALDMLRCYLRDLPWLSPPDLNEEAFSFFWNALVSILKKSSAKP